MRQVAVTGLYKAFGAHPVLTGVDLEVPAGSLTAILGPSGSGKTTLLRLLAGFERADAGTISIGDGLVDGPRAYVAPERRRIGYVPQEGSLFPHLTVAANVGFGLSAGDRRAGRAADMLEMVSLGGLGPRYPHQLSGGQQQRVALARALVLDPAVLLLDEPLGALDAKLRRSLKIELKALQERVGVTFLYVTHDQEEALTMSDRLAVMNSGRIVQIGTPREVYEEPADTYVADFLGVSNLMEVDVVERGPGARCCVKLGESALDVERGDVDSLGAAHAVIRPERVRIEPHGSPGPNRVSAMVERLVFLGAATQIMLRLPAGAQLQALVQNDGDRSDLAQGTPVHVFLAPDALRVLAGHGADPRVEAETPLALS